ncbi:hypothetical protein [Pseudomonas fluorescens]|jgi:hypothetical protein|uniref:hypothetical protein n=1 Tax=Pseudomonas fluorescens TaxID=294 RepID=UPI00099BDF9F|nr:hypothetical protein [Pseudomonas fluorescens]NNB71534.1 hypothetical protein [Pseudomonas fluorescens]
MTDKSQIVQGLPLAQWEASFRPGIQEFAASTFTFTTETHELVRIAFGNGGPFINESERSPVFTHAVTLSPSVAVEFARMLLEHFAKPTDDPNKPIAAI